MSRRKRKQAKQSHEDLSNHGNGQRMSMREAMDLVNDDMPDGAYWALAHEMAGLEYGDGFDELIDDDEDLE